MTNAVGHTPGSSISTSPATILEGKEVMDLMRHRAVFDRLARIIHGDAENGQGLAEYALILALIAIIAIVALIYLGAQISDKLSIIGSAI